LAVSETQVLGALAHRIKTMRRRHRLTQEQLAHKAAMQRSYLADLERGSRNPSIRTLVRIANAFGVPVSALFDSEKTTRRS
jgi:transcriptional regulator with XRE-family HTH domain